MRILDRFKLAKDIQALDTTLLRAQIDEIYKQMAMPQHMIQGPNDEISRVGQSGGAISNGPLNQASQPQQSRTPRRADNFDLPDFCFDTNFSSFRTTLSPLGMLFLRLHWQAIRDKDPGMQTIHSYPVGKFGIPGIAFIDAVPIKTEQKMNLIVWVEKNDKTMTIEDDLNLFPSDTLLVKLRALESK